MYGPWYAKRGKGSVEPSIPIGCEDTGDPYMKNVFHPDHLGTRGQQRRRQLITRPPAVDDRFTLSYLAKHEGDKLTPHQNINKRPARRNTPTIIRDCFSRCLEEHWNSERLFFVKVFSLEGVVYAVLMAVAGTAGCRLQAINSSPHLLSSRAAAGEKETAAERDLTTTKAKKKKTWPEAGRLHYQ